MLGSPARRKQAKGAKSARDGKTRVVCTGGCGAADGKIVQAHAQDHLADVLRLRHLPKCCFNLPDVMLDVDKRFYRHVLNP